MATLLRIAIVSTALFQLAFAQVKGAPVTGSGGSSGGGTPILPIAVYGSVVNGPTVGPDGNAYAVVTTVQTTTTSVTSKMELVSVGPSGNSGQPNWALPIDGTFVSAPAFSTANKGFWIILTTSEPTILPLASAGATPVAAKEPMLYIIPVISGLVGTPLKVPITANTLSAPQVSPDGQTIYFIAQTSPFFTPGTTTSITPASATLYAYSLSGKQGNFFKLY